MSTETVAPEKFLEEITKISKKMTSLQNELIAVVTAFVKGEEVPTGKKSKKASGPPRKQSAWTAWVSAVRAKHEKEYKEFCDASEDKKSLAFLFAKKWREDHAEEYTAFEAEHASADAPVEEKPKEEKKVAKPASKKAKEAESEASASEAEAPKVAKKVVKKK